MTEKQIKWQEALLNPSAKPKLKQNAMVRLITSGISPVTVLAWAKMGAKSFSK
jgi:hypothetical protein